ncbi:IS66-like element accessory protein TnpA [Bradyrhizobium viridifuturi]|uniref:IS66-like element accessory protein TnpA n=1 Tax=Bradyrhizobium viridifuturi TaxID=1654716 RepID=UPI0007C767F2|nr:transposase [Bradyrhizobium viridifuturi]
MITPEEPLKLETVGVLRNGRRRYDPASKQRLVEACLQPGVSLAGLALQHGVNANLLHKWVAKRPLQSEDGQPEARAPIAPAFIPVCAPSPTRSTGAIAVCATERSCAGRLTASMPNGVTLSLKGGDAQLLSAVIEALGRCDVPTGV